MNPEDYMLNYDIFFLDGSHLSLENVAISSAKNEKSRGRVLSTKTVTPFVLYLIVR